MLEASARDRGITSKDAGKDGHIADRDGRITGKDTGRDSGRDRKSTITISRVKELFQSQEFSFTHI